MQRASVLPTLESDGGCQRERGAESDEPPHAASEASGSPAHGDVQREPEVDGIGVECDPHRAGAEVEIEKSQIV